MDRRRFSFSGVNGNTIFGVVGDEANGGDGDIGGDNSVSLPMPMQQNSSSPKSENLDELLWSLSLWLLVSLESRFSDATAVSYDASLFCGWHKRTRHE